MKERRREILDVLGSPNEDVRQKEDEEIEKQKERRERRAGESRMKRRVERL